MALISTPTMTIKFLHTADIHLGKTYRTSTDGQERYEDFFATLADIVALRADRIYRTIAEADEELI